MADIHVQKRNAIWPWILGLVVLALLIWAFVGSRTAEQDVLTTPTATIPPTEPVTTTDRSWRDETITGMPGTTADTTTMPPAAADEFGADLPIVAIIEQPEQYAGQTVTGTAVIAEVESDRGLWVEEDGERLLVVMAAQPTAAQTGADQPATATERAQAATGQQGAQQQAQPATGEFRAGQTVQLVGVIHDEASARGALAQDPQLQALIDEQPVVLIVQQGGITAQTEAGPGQRY